MFSSLTARVRFCLYCVMFTYKINKVNELIIIPDLLFIGMDKYMMKKILSSPTLQNKVYNKKKNDTTDEIAAYFVPGIDQMGTKWNMLVRIECLVLWFIFYWVAIPNTTKSGFKLLWIYPERKGHIVLKSVAGPDNSHKNHARHWGMLALETIFLNDNATRTVHQNDVITNARDSNFKGIWQFYSAAGALKRPSQCTQVVPKNIAWWPQQACCPGIICHLTANNESAWCGHHCKKGKDYCDVKLFVALLQNIHNFRLRNNYAHRWSDERMKNQLPTDVKQSDEIVRNVLDTSLKWATVISLSDNVGGPQDTVQCFIFAFEVVFLV